MNSRYHLIKILAVIVFTVLLFCGCKGRTQNNTQNTTNNDPESLAGKTLITTFACPFELRFDDGTTLFFDGDEFSGDAKTDSVKFNPNGESRPADVTLILPGSHFFQYINKNDKSVSFFVSTEHYTAAVAGEAISDLRYSENGVTTNVNEDSEVKTVFFDEQSNMITVRGIVDDMVTASYKNDTLTIQGINNDGIVQFSEYGKEIPFTCNGEAITIERP